MSGEEQVVSGEPPRIAFIVSHTHWDREWYQTFGEFRVDLDRVVRGVLEALEAGRIEHFVLDGQAILLEDYLSARPDDADRIRALVEGGRLGLGPWYILPDEFLVSGEATVRNLVMGHEVARPLGGVQKIGYMPDSFGHVAQIPQILRKAGIDSFLYTRGNGDEIDRLGWEFLWRAPDGSEVLAVNQVRGYCNAGGLGLQEVWHAHTPREIDPERAVEQVREIFEAHASRARSNLVLLNNGCDHFPVQRDLDRVLGALRVAFPDTEFRASGFGAYLKTVREAGPPKEVYEGELLGARLHHILSGVWSTRMYLKQANERAQVLLADVVEPLAALNHFVHGAEYPDGLIREAWKGLLRNHPHDSICGCSTDEVHREMEARFESVVRTGEQLVRRGLQRLTPTFGKRAEGDRDTALCVANTLPFPRSEVVRRLVVLQPPAPDVDRLRLVDDSGRSVPFRVERVQRVERFWGIDYRVQLDGESQLDGFATYESRFRDRILRPESERDSADTFLTVEFMADLPALGHARLFLEEDPGGSAAGEEGASDRTTVTVDGPVISNGLVRARLHPNGVFDLVDLRSGREYVGLNLLEDTGDVGDEYDYSEAPDSPAITAAGRPGRVEVVRSGGWTGVLSAGFELPLPVAALADRSGRSAESIPCEAEVRIELRAGSPLVRVRTRFDNRVEDHRLRTRFPTGMRVDHFWSDGHFMVNRRPVGERPDGGGWLQEPPATSPQQEYSLVQADGSGLALLNRGLPELEARNDAEGCVELVLTLLRCVGWLSRDDFASRLRTNAGPTLFTPGAQCPGPAEFQYAVLPFEGDFLEAGVRPESRRYRVPPVTVQGVREGSVAGGGSLLTQEVGAATVTATKRHRCRPTLLVRLYNPHGVAIEEILSSQLSIDGAWRTDLLEEREAELEVTGNRLKVSLGPGEIASLELQLSVSGR